MYKGVYLAYLKGGIMGNVCRLIVALLFMPSFVRAQDTSTSRPPDPKFEVILDVHLFGFSSLRSPVKSISNIPIGLRQLPGHPDDPWAGRIFTVPDKTFPGVGPKTLGGFYNGSGNFLFYNRIGVNLNFEFGHYPLPRNAMESPEERSAEASSANYFNNPAAKSPYINEINQSGVNERGVGTSLVYYYLRFDERNFVYVWPEIELRVVKGLSVLVGRRHYDYDYKTGRGYDRYDEFINVHEDQLGALSVEVPYVGVRVINRDPDDGIGGGLIFLYGFPKSEFVAEIPGIAAPYQRSRYFSINLSLIFPLFRR